MVSPHNFIVTFACNFPINRIEKQIFFIFTSHSSNITLRTRYEITHQREIHYVCTITYQTAFLIQQLSQFKGPEIKSVPSHNFCNASHKQRQEIPSRAKATANNSFQIFFLKVGRPLKAQVITQKHSPQKDIFSCSVQSHIHISQHQVSPMKIVSRQGVTQMMSPGFIASQEKF